MFWNEVRKAVIVGTALKGGLCTRCRSGHVLLSAPSGAAGVMRLSCENCAFSVEECPGCEGTGVLGYDSRCDDCDSFGVKPRP